MSDKVAQERPAPAVDQIWRCQVGPGCHFEITIGAVKDGVVWPVNTRDLPQAIVSLTQARWSCIGLVTPHGRVMVGETREGTKISSVRPRHWRVVEVVDSDVIRMTDGNVTLRFSAHVVARWPLISPPAPAEPAREAEPTESYKRTAGCLCTWEEGDSECPVHPTCPECGCATCECSPDARLYPLRALGSAVARACTLAAEQGPGISRLPPPEVRHDMVVTAAWEDRWTTP